MNNLFGLPTVSPVVIVANTTLPNNPIITPLLDDMEHPKVDNNGNELGSIRVQQKTLSMAGGSFLNERNRVAFVAADIKVLQGLVARAKLKDGTEIPGKIQVIESLDPFYVGQPAKINPQTREPVGVTIGEVFYPVYLRMIYVEDVSAKDTYIRTPEDVYAWQNVRTALRVQDNIASVAQPAVPTT